MDWRTTLNSSMGFRPMLILLHIIIMLLRSPSDTTVEEQLMEEAVKHEELAEAHTLNNNRQSDVLGDEITSSGKNVATCQPLHYVPDAETRPVTALASFPGSGNTWLRHLIQQATGVYTGSQYTDEELLNNGFPGEPVFNASVAVVKTHEWGPKIRDKFQKAVLLVRHPKSTIQSYYNLNKQGHTGCASKEDYQDFTLRSWKNLVKRDLLDWKLMNLDWIHNFKGPLHVVLYDELRADLGRTLRSLVKFLDLPLNETSVQCAIDNREGLYHRKPCPETIEYFTEDLKSIIEAFKFSVMREVEKYSRNLD